MENSVLNLPHPGAGQKWFGVNTIQVQTIVGVMCGRFPFIFPGNVQIGIKFGRSPFLRVITEAPYYFIDFIHLLM